MNKIIKYVQKLCEILEVAAAVLVLIGIILSVASLIGNPSNFSHLLEESSAFKHYLEDVFTIVIGIEFVGMLSHPSSDNVLEMLIFLVARHMVVGDTTPYEDFVSVVSVALLCLVRRYLHSGKKKETEQNTEKETGR